MSTVKITEKMAFSEDLRDVIAASGKSANAISIEAGISQGALSRFLRRERGITLETADRLASYFGLRLVAKERPKSAAKRKA